MNSEKAAIHAQLPIHHELNIFIFFAYRKGLEYFNHLIMLIPVMILFEWAIDIKS